MSNRQFLLLRIGLVAMIVFLFLFTRAWAEIPPWSPQQPAPIRGEVGLPWWNSLPACAGPDTTRAKLERLEVWVARYEGQLPPPDPQALSTLDYRAVVDRLLTPAELESMTAVWYWNPPADSAGTWAYLIYAVSDQGVRSCTPVPAVLAVVFPWGPRRVENRGTNADRWVGPGW